MNPLADKKDSPPSVVEWGVLVLFVLGLSAAAWWGIAYLVVDFLR